MRVVFSVALNTVSVTSRIIGRETHVYYIINLGRVNFASRVRSSISEPEPEVQSIQ